MPSSLLIIVKHQLGATDIFCGSAQRWGKSSWACVFAPMPDFLQDSGGLRCNEAWIVLLVRVKRLLFRCLPVFFTRRQLPESCWWYAASVDHPLVIILTATMGTSSSGATNSCPGRSTCVKTSQLSAETKLWCAKQRWDFASGGTGDLMSVTGWMHRGTSGPFCALASAAMLCKSCAFLTHRSVA